MAKIRTHKDLEVYQMAYALAMEIFQLSQTFPKEEKYSLTDQIRRSSRSVCANLAEGFRKRRYPASFMAKMVDCEAEAAEVQTWLDFTRDCNYINDDVSQSLYNRYDHVIGKLVIMGNQAEKWKP